MKRKKGSDVLSCPLLIVAHLLLIASETAGYVYSGSEDEGDPTVAGGTIRDSKEQLGRYICLSVCVYCMVVIYDNVYWLLLLCRPSS